MYIRIFLGPYLSLNPGSISKSPFQSRTYERNKFKVGSRVGKATWDIVWFFLSPSQVDQEDQRSSGFAETHHQSSQALVWVKTIVRKHPDSDETKIDRLCMLDPHELLQWLWQTKRLYVSDTAIE